jgi:Type IV secretion-system coupling protein DNA-binding domain
MLGVIILWSWIGEIAATGIEPPSLRGIHVLLGIIFVFSASALVGAILARRKPASALKRGAVLLDDAQQESSADRPNALTLAGHPIPFMDETKHFKIIGTTGTGKSTAIRELLTGALRRGDRAVITDPDGGYLKQFYNPGRGDVILNPFDPRAARWDLFGEILLPQDADQLARSFIPDYDGQDRNWRGYARLAFTHKYFMIFIQLSQILEIPSKV